MIVLVVGEAHGKPLRKRLYQELLKKQDVITFARSTEDATGYLASLSQKPHCVVALDKGLKLHEPREKREVAGFQFDWSTSMDMPVLRTMTLRTYLDKLAVLRSVFSENLLPLISHCCDIHVDSGNVVSKMGGCRQSFTPNERQLVAVLSLQTRSLSGDELRDRYYWSPGELDRNLVRKVRRKLSCGGEQQHLPMGDYQICAFARVETHTYLEHPYFPHSISDTLEQTLLAKGRVLLVAPPLWGKTTLLKYLVEIGSDRGLRVLHASQAACTDAVHDGGYDVVVWDDAVGRVVASPEAIEAISRLASTKDLGIIAAVRPEPYRDAAQLFDFSTAGFTVVPGPVPAMLQNVWTSYVGSIVKNGSSSVTAALRASNFLLPGEARMIAEALSSRRQVSRRELAAMIRSTDPLASAIKMWMKRLSEPQRFFVVAVSICDGRPFADFAFWYERMLARWRSHFQSAFRVADGDWAELLPWVVVGDRVEFCHERVGRSIRDRIDRSYGLILSRCLSVLVELLCETYRDDEQSGSARTHRALVDSVFSGMFWSPDSREDTLRQIFGSRKAVFGAFGCIFEFRGDSIVVAGVTDDSELMAAGVPSGVVVVSIDGSAVRGPDDLARLVLEPAKREGCRLLLRDEAGREFTVNAKPSVKPAYLLRTALRAEPVHYGWPTIHALDVWITLAAVRLARRGAQLRNQLLSVIAEAGATTDAGAATWLLADHEADEDALPIHVVSILHHIKGATADSQHALSTVKLGNDVVISILLLNNVPMEGRVKKNGAFSVGNTGRHHWLPYNIGVYQGDAEDGSAIAIRFRRFDWIALDEEVLHFDASMRINIFAKAICGVLQGEADRYFGEEAVQALIEDPGPNTPYSPLNAWDMFGLTSTKGVELIEQTEGLFLEGNMEHSLSVCFDELQILDGDFQLWLCFARDSDGRPPRSAPYRIHYIVTPRRAASVPPTA